MKMKIAYTIIITVVVFLASCSNDDSSPIFRQGDLQIQTQKDTWTYVSLESGNTIGTCALGDSIAEKTWSQRTDWDIAICNGMIRTNSGTSGIGHGGIVNIMPDFYETADVAPEDDYKTDTDTTYIW